MPLVNTGSGGGGGLQASNMYSCCWGRQYVTHVLPVKSVSEGNYFPLKAFQQAITYR
jgi:hypothetical protein